MMWVLVLTILNSAYNAPLDAPRGGAVIYSIQGFPDAKACQEASRTWVKGIERMSIQASAACLEVTKGK